MNFYFDNLPTGGKRTDYITKIMEIIIYVNYLPEVYKPESPNFDDEYIKNLIMIIAAAANIHPCFVAYAMYHFGELITEKDLAKEKSFILAVYQAYRNNDRDLKVKLLFANKSELASMEAEIDAKTLSFDDFYAKYRHWKDYDVGTFMNDHIHVIFYYTYETNYKLNLFTVRYNLLGSFGNEYGWLYGLSNPFIPHGNINNAVYYLGHEDDPFKKHYMPTTIICVNCNDGIDRYYLGAPPSTVADRFRTLCQMAKDYELYDLFQLTEYLIKNDHTLLDFCFSQAGKGYADKAVRIAYKEHIAKIKKEERHEDVEFKKIELNIISDNLLEKRKANQILDEIAKRLKMLFGDNGPFGDNIK